MFFVSRLFILGHEIDSLFFTLTSLISYKVKIPVRICMFSCQIVAYSDVDLWITNLYPLPFWKGKAKNKLIHQKHFCSHTVISGCFSGIEESFGCLHDHTSSSWYQKVVSLSFPCSWFPPWELPWHVWASISSFRATVICLIFSLLLATSSTCQKHPDDRKPKTVCLSVTCM